MIASLLILKSNISHWTLALRVYSFVGNQYPINQLMKKKLRKHWNFRKKQSRNLKVYQLPPIQFLGHQHYWQFALHFSHDQNTFLWYNTKSLLTLQKRSIAARTSKSPTTMTPFCEEVIVVDSWKKKTWQNWEENKLRLELSLTNLLLPFANANHVSVLW